MKYYFVFSNACCEFDDQTIFQDVGKSSLKANKIGLIFDWWPLDDLFSCHPELFCTERLKFILESDIQKFSGIEFDSVERVSTGANWNDNFPSAKPGYYWHIKITGNALEDDFGFWSEKRYLIISKRALKFLLQNHVTEILGSEIKTEISDYFENYEKQLKESKYTALPPKIIDVDNIFS